MRSSLTAGHAATAAAAMHAFSRNWNRGGELSYAEPASTGGLHEETQKVRVFVEGQKVGEKRASENRLDAQARRQENRVKTQARRQEGGRRDRHCLNANAVQLANR
jgi:hypothetical protein